MYFQFKTTYLTLKVIVEKLLVWKTSKIECRKKKIRPLDDRLE